MKKTRYPVMNMGTVSILTIFIILCMVTFATLTYISTRKDASFADQLAERTIAYYTAAGEAHRRIAKIDGELRQAWEDGTWQNTQKTYEFSVPVEEGRDCTLLWKPAVRTRKTVLFSVSCSSGRYPQRNGTATHPCPSFSRKTAMPSQKFHRRNIWKQKQFYSAPPSFALPISLSSQDVPFPTGRMNSF